MIITRHKGVLKVRPSGRSGRRVWLRWVSVVVLFGVVQALPVGFGGSGSSEVGGGEVRPAGAAVGGGGEVTRAASGETSYSCPSAPASFSFSRRSGETCYYTRSGDATRTASASTSYSCPSAPSLFSYSRRNGRTCYYTRSGSTTRTAVSSTTYSCPSSPSTFSYNRRNGRTCYYTRSGSTTRTARTSTTYSCPSSPSSFSYSRRNGRTCYYTRSGSTTRTATSTTTYTCPAAPSTYSFRSRSGTTCNYTRSTSTTRPAASRTVYTCPTAPDGYTYNRRNGATCYYTSTTTTAAPTTTSTTSTTAAASTTSTAVTTTTAATATGTTTTVAGSTTSTAAPTTTTASRCLYGQRLDGTCRACSNPEEVSINNRCVPKTTADDDDLECREGQLYYSSYGECRTTTTTTTTTPAAITTTATTVAATATTTTTLPSTAPVEVGIPPICTVSGRTVSCKADVPTGRQFVEYEWTWTPTSGRKSTRTNTHISSNNYHLASSLPSGKLEIHTKYNSNYLSPKQVFQISTDNDDIDIDWDNVLYGPIVCTDYSTTQNAVYYLNMSRSDPGNCPPPGMFRSSSKTGYIPVWGYEKFVAKVYGKVAVRQDGQCSRWRDIRYII